jgi:hemolysin III
MYHSLTNRTAKKVFKVFDHSTIYLLIAGSYTPITLVYLRDSWGYPIFFFVWGATIMGIVLKSIWIDRFKVLSLVLYALMGWCIIIAIPTVLDKVPLEALVLILEGGIAYTVGIPFYIAKDRPYFHAIWHVLVLGGTMFQFFGILLFIIPVL